MTTSIVPQSRANIIIATDDFGIKPEATKNILSLARGNMIHRVSVMANYIDSSSDVEALKKTGARLDIHLEIMQLLRRSPGFNSAVSRSANFLFRYVTAKITPGIIEKAWKEQIELFYKYFGRYPDGLNSHEHVHFFPKFFPVFLKLAEKYPISYIRFGKKGVLTSHHNLSSVIIGACRKINLRHYATCKIPTADFITSFHWFRSVEELSLRLPYAHTTEIIFHPERKEEYDELLSYFSPHHG